MSLLKNEGIIHHGLDQGEPKEENERLRRLYRTNILDTPPEQDFENIVELCLEICDAPIALISFIDRDRQWNKAKVGMEINELPRKLSFCTHCIESDEEVYEVRDAQDHGLFSENPFVNEHPHIRFYAGAPMIDSQGQALGCVCVIDHKPRRLEEKERFFLKTMADQVVREIENRADHAELLRTKQELDSSIDYARHIQEALLKPSDPQVRRAPEHFVFLRPLEELSGDFFWAREHEGYFYMAAMDCTGHGVPGAFLSMLGVSFLNEIFNENGALPPGEVLSMVRERMIQELKGYDPLTGARDGMDASMVKIPIENSKEQHGSKKEVQFAGAQNPLYVIRRGIADEGPDDPYAFLPGRVRPFKDSSDGIEVKGDRTPIGYNEFGPGSFETVTLELQKRDMLYLFSDGFADQFGGSRGKKFQYGAFKRLLTRIHRAPMEKQKARLQRSLESWKKESDQDPTDDVLVLGIRL